MAVVVVAGALGAGIYLGSLERGDSETRKRAEKRKATTKKKGDKPAKRTTKKGKSSRAAPSGNGNKHQPSETSEVRALRLPLPAEFDPADFKVLSFVGTAKEQAARMIPEPYLSYIFVQKFQRDGTIDITEGAFVALRFSSPNLVDTCVTVNAREKNLHALRMSGPSCPPRIELRLKCEPSDIIKRHLDSNVPETPPTRTISIQAYADEPALWELEWGNFSKQKIPDEC